MKKMQDLNPFPNKPWLLRVCSRSLLKTLWEKEKLLATTNFPFSHNVFYPFGELSTIFVKFEIIVCKFFQFGKSLKFVLWERIKGLFHIILECDILDPRSDWNQLSAVELILNNKMCKSSLVLGSTRLNHHHHYYFRIFFAQLFVSRPIWQTSAEMIFLKTVYFIDLHL